MSQSVEVPSSHTLPPLGRYAPSGLVASLPRKDYAPPNVLAHYATGSKEVQTRLIMTDKFTTLRGVRSRSRSEVDIII